MVAQVRALDLATQRLEREHEVPRHAHPLEPSDRGPVAGVREVAQVVEQHPHPDPTAVGGLEGVEESGGRVIQQQDVELDVHRLGGRVDRRRHGVERLLVVRVQPRAVAADEGHRAEGAVQLDDRFEPRRPRRVELHSVEALGGLEDVVIDLLLALASLLRQPGAPHEQEQQDADVGNEEDRQQPRERRLRPPVARHVDEREHADDEVHDEQGDRQGHGEPALIGRRLHGGSLSTARRPAVTGSSRTAPPRRGPCP